MRVLFFVCFVVSLLVVYGCSDSRPVVKREDIFVSVANRLPDFRDYFTPKELNSFLEQIARQYPKLMSLNLLTKSQNGMPIYEVQMGQGKRHVLVYGFSQGNNAAGAMMLVYLIRELASNELLRSQLDVTWHFVPCVEPDAAALNEGWFKSVLTLTNYARNYYMLPFQQQVEQAFPRSSGNHTNGTSSAVIALQKIIDENQIELMVDLGSSIFGHGHISFSKQPPEVYGLLYNVAETQGFPIAPRRQDSPHLATAIERYVLSKNPSALVVNTSFPQFMDAQTLDKSAVQAASTAALQQSYANYKTLIDFTRNEYTKVKPLLTHPSPFTGALDAILADRSLYDRDPSTQTPELNTNGEVVAATINYTVSGLIAIGQLQRLLQAEKAALATTPLQALDTSLTEVSKQFSQQAEQAQHDIHYSVMSIQRIARIQLLTVLLLANELSTVPQRNIEVRL